VLEVDDVLEEVEGGVEVEEEVDVVVEVVVVELVDVEVDEVELDVVLVDVEEDVEVVVVELVSVDLGHGVKWSEIQMLYSKTHRKIVHGRSEYGSLKQYAKPS
jgi:hypothetical protein